MSPSNNKRQNALARWSADRMAAILNGLGDAVLVADADGTLAFCNDLAADLLGIEPTDSLPEIGTVGRELRLADGETPCPLGSAPWELAAAGHVGPEAEWSLRVADRSTSLPVRIRATPVHDSQGRVDGVVVVFHDLTSAKQAERQRMQRRLLALAESSPDAIVIVNEAGEIVLANSAAETIFGYAREELLGKSVESLIPQRYRQDHPQLRNRFLAGPRRRTMAAAIELRGLRKGGGEFPAEISLNAIETPDGSVVCCAIRDLTERKQVEEKLRDQQAELAHVARLSTMGEMAAGLAHELNQPLTAIAAFADGTALRLKQGTIAPGDLANVVDRIAADAHRAGEIIRRLRQFVRKRETEMALVDLNTLVREVFRFLDYEIARRQVAVDFHFAADLPPVHADAIEMQQVVLNLVRNALDALMQNKPTDRKCLATTAAGDGSIVMTVEDSGRGIAPELRERVFEPFYTSRDEGLGMGLAISRSIVEAHRGRIAVGQSDLGGACVRVILPTAEEIENERR